MLGSAALSHTLPLIELERPKTFAGRHDAQAETGGVGIQSPVKLAVRNGQLCLRRCGFSIPRASGAPTTSFYNNIQHSDQCEQAIGLLHLHGVMNFYSPHDALLHFMTTDITAAKGLRNLLAPAANANGYFTAHCV